jgi:hypothetical protein
MRSMMMWRIAVRPPVLACFAALSVIACEPKEVVAPGKGGLSADRAVPLSEIGAFVICKSTPAGTHGTFQVDVSWTEGDGSDHSAGYFIQDGECIVVKEMKEIDAAQSPATFRAFEHVDYPGTTPGFTLTGTTVIQGSSTTTQGNPGTCTVTLTTSCTVVFNNTTSGGGGGGGKTFTIGPSSMEGAIKISNGDWVNGGYSFKFVNGSHIETDFTVQATVSITGPCIGGGPATDTFTFPLNDATYDVPANNTNWLPTGDANSVLSWQGSVIASGVCGGIGKLDASKGAVFMATVSQSPPTGSLVDFRFKYRDPAAKGKPNTNCLDTSDPNRSRADVCGASWSQTVRDP